MIFVKESESYNGHDLPVAFLNLMAARFFLATSLSISFNLASFLWSVSYNFLEALRTSRYAFISVNVPLILTLFWFPVIYLMDSIIILCLFIETLLLCNYTSSCSLLSILAIIVSI